MQCKFFLQASVLLLLFGQTHADTIQTSEQTGATIMTHTSSGQFLEAFNQPELFLTDVKNLDTQQIVWDRHFEKRFTRPDGVEAWIMSNDDRTFGKIYTEDLTYPNSPFRYRNVYNEKGYLIRKFIDFYNVPLYGIYDCADGKCVPAKVEKYTAMQPVIPLERTRAAFLKEIGVDLYDASRVRDVGLYSASSIESQPYYVRIGRPVGMNDEMLVDAETGKIIYRRNIFCEDEGQRSFAGELEPEGSHAYIKSEAMVKKFMTKKDELYQVYKKANAKEPGRFYEALVITHIEMISDDGVIADDLSRPIVSFLLDHKKEKILYRFEAKLSFERSEPFVDLLTEYRQHLKMLEAQEEKPGLFGRFRKKE